MSCYVVAIRNYKYTIGVQASQNEDVLHINWGILYLENDFKGGLHRTNIVYIINTSKQYA